VAHQKRKNQAEGMAAACRVIGENNSGGNMARSKAKEAGSAMKRVAAAAAA